MGVSIIFWNHKSKWRTWIQVLTGTGLEADNLTPQIFQVNDGCSIINLDRWLLTDCLTWIQNAISETKTDVHCMRKGYPIFSLEIVRSWIWQKLIETNFQNQHNLR